MERATDQLVDLVTGTWCQDCPAALVASRRGYFYPVFYAYYFAAYLPCSTPRRSP